MLEGLAQELMVCALCDYSIWCTIRNIYVRLRFKHLDCVTLFQYVNLSHARLENTLKCYWMFEFWPRWSEWKSKCELNYPDMVNTAFTIIGQWVLTWFWLHSFRHYAMIYFPNTCVPFLYRNLFNKIGSQSVSWRIYMVGKFHDVFGCDVQSFKLSKHALRVY